MAVFQRCCRRWYSLARSHCSICGKRLDEIRPKTYAVDIYHLGGRRERVTVGTSRAVAETIEAQQREKRRRERFSPTPPPMGFAALAENYLAGLRGRGGLSTARSAFRILCTEWGGLRTDKITPEMIEAFRVKLLQTGRGRAWIDYIVAVAQAAYNRHHLPNPFQRIKPYRPDTRIVRYLTNEERKALMIALRDSPPYFQEIFLVALNTGLRRNEVLQLRRDQVDFEHGIIQVRQKGNRLHIIPMNGQVMDVLKDIPEGGTPYFWVNPQTQRPYTMVFKAWIKLKERAGITRPFRWHDLRHDFLTRIVTATGSTRIAQELAGHSSPQQTQRYAHLIDGVLRDAVERISDQKVTHQKKRPK